MTILEAVKIKRARLGISQSALAELVRVRQATISEFESGLRQLGSTTLQKVFEELNIKIQL